MPIKKKVINNAAEVRLEAETRALSQEIQFPHTLENEAPDFIKKILFELRVHQIELEMQNEELLRTQVELENSRSRYYDIFDLAPVGYFTLNDHGIILESNLTAASFLGFTRGTIEKYPFSHFIHKRDQDNYYLNLKQLIITGLRQVFVLRMLRANGDEFWAHLAISRVEDIQAETTFRITFNDISELKRAESLKIKSENHFKALFEQAAMGVALIETQSGHFIDINQKYCEFIGYSKNELLNLNFQTITYPEDIPLDEEKIHLLLTREIREFSIEKRYIHKNGHILWGKLTVSPLWVPEENPTKYIHIAIVEDISRRKKNEFALEESKRKLEQLFEILPVGVSVLDRDHHVTISNTAHARILGLSPEALLDGAYRNRRYIRTDGTLFPPEEFPSERVFNGEAQVLNVEIGLEKEDGSTVWTAVSAVTGHVQDWGTVILTTDITERKVMENSLRKSENLYRSLFENMLNGFAYCHFLQEEGKPDDFSHLLVNKSFENLTGLTDVVGKRISQVIPGFLETDTDLMQLYKRVALSGVSETLEMYIISLKMWFSLSVYCPVKDYFVVVFDVISDRINAQQQIQEQVTELQKWYSVTLGREERILQLKEEVNDLLGQIGKPSRYSSADSITKTEGN
ncbi:MAG: PAS domain S-box protein [Chloroflexi bacterium]|nr:PAS domain S-box protein [Chloroflexota bacterium]